MRIERRDGHRLLIGGPVPKGAAAVTVGNVIIVRSGAECSPYVMRQQTVRVRQWRRHGTRFLAHYLSSYAVWRLRGKGHLGACRRVPAEVEADWVARRQLGTAVGAPLLAVEGTPR
jgi:hypothetical protein